MGWVDFDRREAEATQVLLRQLSTPEARDELGIGAIRDAFSDLMFPGTSTVQTRLRYFVLLPRIFRDITPVLRKARDRRAVLREAEADLIERLRKSGEDMAGLIGREAGADIKRMPSSVYWLGLGEWGIRDARAKRSGIGEVLERMATGDMLWDESIPSSSGATTLGFCLNNDEKDWIVDRVATHAGGGEPTLLSWLFGRADEVASKFGGKWGRLQSLSDLREIGHGGLNLPPEFAMVLDRAVRFASIMHGAALLYNLLLARHFARGRGEDPLVAKYQDELDHWRKEARPAWEKMRSVDLLIEPLSKENGRRPPVLPRLHPATKAFVANWMDVGRRDPSGSQAEALIREREMVVRTQKARLTKDPTQYVWNGASGAGRLDFRWQTVRQYLHDLTAVSL
ncbi:DUF6361 family protein [Mesorhizobium loti]|uniref:DUF6361 family protein n=1 Tax=Rhizobium loti TaxID=381 RepID=UPI00047CB3B7|nr:DUF6361 family protein [Mesorhizobium loti]